MKLPDPWLKLLKKLNTAHPTGCILAGGALRDLDLGLEPKDLDIFISAGDLDEADLICAAIGAKPSDFEEREDWEPAAGTGVYPQGMSELILVTELENNPLDIPVQIVFANWRAQSILERFDIGLCKIAYIGGEIYQHRDYKIDKQDKRLTIVRAEGKENLTASLRRLIRWQDKFSDYNIFIGEDVVVKMNKHVDAGYRNN